ncbi:MAG: DUF4199 domain-containing protein [Reichenbachiella sp.]|uniref:DUF4199 domain-containing protein n=1 Tax=Reichenbachiella sp. TaxID=2184521 RepID=UPI0032634674
MKNLALKYGAWSALIMCVTVVIPLLIWDAPAENPYGEILGYASMILALSAIYFGIRRQKEESGGTLTFKEGFMFGTLVNFVAAVVFAVFSYALYAWLMPDFLQSYMDMSINKVMEDSSLSDSQRSQQLDYINDNKDIWLSPAIGGAMMFGTVFPIGLVMTLISSMALKSK